MELISPKNEARENLFILISIMIFSTLLVSTVTISILYSVSYNEYKGRLQELAQSQARIIEASANYQLFTEHKSLNEVESTLLLQLNSAYNNYYGFKDTGEFIFAKRSGGNIQFLFTLKDVDHKLILPIQSELEAPMEMALNGESGIIVGLDSDGQKVLAAFEYIKYLDFGIVAKIDLVEINRPFLKASVIVSIVTIISVILSSTLFYRVRTNILNVLKEEQKNLLKVNKKLNDKIIEHNETENALIRSEERLRLIIKLSPIPMLIAGVDKKIDFYNYKFIELFGYTVDDFSDGETLWDAIFPDKEYRAKAYSTWYNVVSIKRGDREKVPIQIWNITTKFGSVRKCEVYVVVTEDTSFLVLNDVTEQKSLQNDLIKAKERAEELSEVKSKFLSTISHEIRTPINGVLGMTELILGTDVSDEQRKYARGIKISGNILLELINDLLDISKIEANMLTLESFDFNLKSMIEDFIEIQNYKTRGRDIKLSMEIDKECPILLKGDPGRIRQVLLNLIGNAFKFTKSGKISVYVEKTVEHYGGVTIKFTVKDTGIGIPKENLIHIFDKFTQVDISTTRKYGGSGLGLAICKELVEAMGGTIIAESKPGEGSIFSFSIDLIKQPIKSDINYKSNLLVNSLDTINVLVYCDIQSDSLHVCGLMKYWNVDTQISSSQKDVIRTLKESREGDHPIKILFLDIEEDKWDSFCRLIKSNETIKDTQIVIVTNYGDRGDVKYLGDIGYAAYLIKPLKKADLHDVLLSLINFNGKEHQIITKHSIRDMLWDNPIILVADDNKINQRVATGILEKNGFIVDVVSNGLEAIDSLSDRHYSLVLMDCNMPKLDGYDASKIIRSKDSSVIDNDIPIIAMTANVSERDRQKSFKYGMNDFISKPIEPEILIETINRNLN